MPSLPDFRGKRARPFKYVGIDFCGPVLVKNEVRKTKVWCCVYTCLVIRAIHLELVRGLSADLFLNCFKRFVARRGRPCCIYLDNAHNLKASVGKLSREQERAVINGSLDYSADNGIRWRFITEYAPWKGGFYERMIEMVEAAMKKVIGRRDMNEDGFETLLCGIESVLNERPLTYISSESEDRLLRPIDLISPEANLNSTRGNQTLRVKRRKAMFLTPGNRKCVNYSKPKEEL